MALMQIAEPGQSPEPHQKQLVLGIDLGTTHSIVASIKNGAAQCLPDNDGKTLLPSVVTYTKQSVLVGNLSSEFTHADSLTIRSIKRFIGRSSAEVEALLNTYPVSYEWDFSNPAKPLVKTPQGLKTPVEISSEILKALKNRAVEHFGVDQVNLQLEDTFRAVITVPAYFDDAQRQATHDAARLAGITVLRLINEPTAAALAYGIKENGNHLVYDFGGGTFDVSVISKHDELYEVLATSGNTFLGGDDIDEVLRKWFVARYPDFNDKKNRFIFKAAKEQLSTLDKVDIQEKTVTKNNLNQVMEPILSQTLKFVKQVVSDAKLDYSKIISIMLVGGSSRSPLVSKLIQEKTGLFPRNDANPDEVVALGALAQARKMTSTEVSHLLLDVCPLSLGLETMGGIVEKIIPRNTPIPVTKKQVFTTMKNGQSALLLHVLQGEREAVEFCRSLAKFELRNIPALAAGVARIEVQFEMDANGVLNVSAKELSTDIQTTIQVKPSHGLTEDDLLNLLEEAQQNGQNDLEKRLLKTAKIELDRIIEACDYAFEKDRSLLSDEEIIDFTNALNTARNCSLDTNSSRDQHTHARENLNKVSETLAARRMDKAIQSALEGTYIN